MHNDGDPVLWIGVTIARLRLSGNSDFSKQLLISLQIMGASLTEYRFINLVEILSYPVAAEDFKDFIIFSISSFVVLSKLKGNSDLWGKLVHIVLI